MTGFPFTEVGIAVAIPRDMTMNDTLTITSCEILWSENAEADALRGRAFPTLRALDRAVAEAFDRVSAPIGGAYDKTGYRLTFSDGETYEGRCDITNEMCRNYSLIREWLVRFHTNIADESPEARERWSWVTDDDRATSRELLAVIERSEQSAHATYLESLGVI